jgi:hypothetical protein
MIKLRYLDVNSKELEYGLKKLNTYTKFPAKIAYRIGRAVQDIQRQMQKIAKGYDEIFNDHVKKEANGLPVKNKQGEFEFNDMGKWKQAFSDYMQTEFEIKILPIPIDDLNDVGLSPDEILALEKFIDMADKPSLSLLKPGEKGLK